jgi:hypothetical protein
MWTSPRYSDGAARQERKHLQINQVLKLLVKGKLREWGDYLPMAKWRLRNTKAQTAPINRLHSSADGIWQSNTAALVLSPVAGGLPQAPPKGQIVHRSSRRAFRDDKERGGPCLSDYMHWEVISVTLLNLIFSLNLSFLISNVLKMSYLSPIGWRVVG